MASVTIVCHTIIIGVLMAKFKFIDWLVEFFLLKKFDFEWDKGNEAKSEEKHGLTIIECEEVFPDEALLPLGLQVSPEVSESRYGIIGITAEGKILFISFTFRNSRVRVISARDANKKERGLYEKEIS